MLSVVIPSFNEEEMIARTAARIGGLLDDAEIDCELIFVDDGSSDGTWAEIRRAAAADERVRGLRFSRNFGKEAAIMAGLTDCRGSCAAVIDCDLQQPPETIVEMYRLWEQGYDVVEGRKSSRGREGPLHRLAARQFYRLISRATGFDMSQASDFKLLDRKAVDQLVRMREKHGFFRALSMWVGFRSTTVSYDVHERTAGESKWSGRQLTRYALRNISSFTTAPMQVVTVLGIVMLVVAVVLGVTALVQKCMGIAVAGFTTVILLQLFCSSIVMISIGILGYYIANIFEEVKGRPLYIVGETCGEADGADGKAQPAPADSAVRPAENTPPQPGAEDPRQGGGEH